MFLCAKAQEHSVFLGIELGGDKDEFVDALEDKGFQFEEEDDECTTLSGLFDGVGARIEVQSTPRSHTVHLVTVYFVEIEGNEVGLLMKTRQIRKQLRRKYAEWEYTHERNLEEWSSEFAAFLLARNDYRATASRRYSSNGRTAAAGRHYSGRSNRKRLGKHGFSLT